MSSYEIIPANGIRVEEDAFVNLFEVVDFEFDESVDKASRTDCSVAAGSGLITGLLSIILGKPLSLEDANEIGGREADKLVIGAARSLGCKLPPDKDLFSKESRCDTEVLAKAIRFLEDRFSIPQDKLAAKFGGGRQHHLRDFAHHPTPLGLFFSILGQFTQEGYGTDTAGAFVRPKFPEGTPIGKNVHEKIALGTINWIFHLVSDLDGSESNPGKGTGIPGPILSMIKELSATPLFKDKKIEYKEDDIPFSVWVSKLFNGTYFRNEDGEPIKFDLRTEMGLATQLAEQSLYVLANEIIVRTFFLISRLTTEIKNNDVKSFRDLERIRPEAYLPLNNRALTRMCTISSGAFLATNAAGSAIKAALVSKGDKKAFAKAFFLNVNYPGIGRFAVACFFDANYAKEDIATAYRKAIAERDEAKRKRDEDLRRLSEQYSFLSLNPSQARLLYSLESMSVCYDIANTRNPEQAQMKTRWKDAWEAGVSESLGVNADGFFIRTSKQVFDLMKSINKNCDDSSWVDLLALELTRFQPYSPLGSGDDKLFKKLAVKTDYLTDVFCGNQWFISEDEVKALRKAHSSAVGTVTGSRKRTAIAAVTTLAATAVTAGGALVFAPQLAVLIAGEAVAGLSGAALTSASLAFIGGGSLAVGGMGMAGGTAILTGGGALIGLAGSGATSAISLAAQSSESFVQNECAKLLAFCTEIAAKKYQRFDIIAQAAKGMKSCSLEIGKQIEKLEESERKADEKLVHQLKKSQKCMDRCEKALNKLLKQQR